MSDRYDTRYDPDDTDDLLADLPDSLNWHDPVPAQVPDPAPAADPGPETEPAAQEAAADSVLSEETKTIPDLSGDTRVMGDIASSMEEYMREVEARWNRNLSTPVSLDQDVQLYHVPIPSRSYEVEPLPEPEPADAGGSQPPAPPAEPPVQAEPDDGDAEVFYDPYEDEDRLPGGLRVLLYVVCVLLASILLALGAWLAAEDVLALTKPDRTVTVTVEEDDTIEDITDMLYENSLIEYKTLFRIYAWVADAEEKISPGVYELNNQYDYHALVSGMQSGYTLPETVTVTIPEGYECSQIFDLLEEYGVCDAESLAETAAEYEFDYDFLDGLAYGDENRLEGYLFPDTYEFYVDDDPEDVLDRFLSNFESKFDDDMLEQMDVLNDWIREQMEGSSEEEIEEHLMTMEKIVIIASLIEKEAAVSSERTSISSVIHNRLVSDLYPYLEIDASIQYILDERKDVLTYSDLEIDSPYNTYLYEGLPPGPICNPGLSCLKAALYPADTNYYYYALNTEGTHTFFETSIEQQAFVNSEDYAGYSSEDDTEDTETEDAAQTESSGETETASDSAEDAEESGA